jgi:hypothetical protein
VLKNSGPAAERHFWGKLQKIGLNNFNELAGHKNCKFAAEGAKTDCSRVFQHYRR